MIIRDIKNDDLEPCSELYSQVFSSSPWSEKWSKEQAYERLNHFYKSEGFIGLIAEKQGIRGFVLGNSEPFLDGNWFYLREMCVSQKNQSQGFGTSLLKKLSAVLSAESVKNIYLATERNIPAARFYEKNGFFQEEKMGFYYKEI